MITFTAEIEGHEYPILIAEDLISNLPRLLDEAGMESQIYIICDQYVHRLCEMDLVEQKLRQHAGTFLLPGKKNSKTFFSVLKIFEDLNNKNISRDTVIIGIGGGVVGDIAAYVAACWYRGVDLIHIPTTLLAAVDSCVGGKAAVNFRNTVNAVGLYYHPRAVFIDTTILRQLPKREIQSGLGEVVKYAALGEKQINEALEAEHGSFEDGLGRVIELSLKKKLSLVTDDVKEAGQRLFLNFGHTIGHAIEFSTIYNGDETLRHGEGVALGMLSIFRICIALGFLTEDDLAHLKGILKRHNLPCDFQAASVGLRRDQLIERIVDLSFKDKKRTKDALRLILLDGIGNPVIYETTDRALIAAGAAEVII